MTVRAWQLVFLVGILVCLAAAVAAFGAGWTLAITGLIAVAIKVITALTGSDDSFVAILQRLLNVRRYLQSAAIGTFVISGGLIGFAIWNSRPVHQPEQPPPFRVSYFLLENYAADLLLQGKIDPKWEQKLAGQSYIVPNSVFQTLKHLERTFSDRLPESDGLFFSKRRAQQPLAAQGESVEDSIKTGMKKGDKVFAGNVLNADRGLPLEELPRFVRLLKNPNHPWKLFGHRDGPIGGLTVFRTYAERGDLDLLGESRFKEFNLYLASQGMPPDFGYVDIYQDDTSGCTDEETAFETFTVIEFVGRTPKLRVAVVENITDAPIKLGKFTLKHNPNTQLRSREEDAAVLARQTPEEISLFAAEILKPGERIVIPIELLMGFRETDDLGEVYSMSTALSEDANLLNEFRDSGPVEFRGGNKERFRVDAATLNQILARQSAKFPLNDDYVFGPSIKIDSVEIGNVRYPLREFDASRLVITEGLAMGSCPYIYTYDRAAAEWTREGVILYGLNEKRKERLDVRRLQNFDGRLLIKEEDEERSFIDSIFVKVVSLDGRETILYPTNTLLSVADQRYVKLKQGDELLVEFSVPRDLVAAQYFVGAIGYYIPDERNRALGIRARRNLATRPNE